MAEDSVKRKLRAILSADVKGYSRMMDEDEVGTYQTLTAYLESIRSIISEHNGRVFSSPGDAVMAQFASVVNAVQCAVEIQEKIETANAEVSEDRKMQFRIGVNLGDVIHDGEQVYGDGVNIAARIETLAEPGSVAISRTVYNHMQKKVNLGYEYKGEHQVKNIAQPVHVYKILTAPEHAGQLLGEPKVPKRLSKQSYISIFVVLALVVSAAIWHFYPRATEIEAASVEKMVHPLPDKPSIAVLPLENLSNDPEQDYIAVGLTDNITTALTQVPDMFVIAKNSANTYKGKSVKIKQVSEELGVRYVLNGSVQISGERLRINVQLADAVEGHLRWAKRYDRKMKDIFALQDEITMKVLTELQVNMTVGDSMYMWGSGTQNLDAYLKSLKFFEIWYRFTKEDNRLAMQIAKEVLALDPKWSNAYLYVGWCYWAEWFLGVSKSPKASLARVEEMARKALELDDENAGAYIQLGYVYASRRKFDKAIEANTKAVLLDPHSGHLFRLAAILKYAGKPTESIPLYKRALRQDPFPKSSKLFLYEMFGSAYADAGQYNEALEVFKGQLDRFNKGEYKPRGPLWGGAPHRWLAATYVMLGQMDKAREHAAELLRVNPKFPLARYEKLLTRQYKNQADVERWIGALRQAGLK